jgi:hypothetical protein
MEKSWPLARNWEASRSRPPEPGARDNDQINLTDEESRLMPVAGGGFEPAYNAQVGVDTATMRVVAVGVTQSPNRREQVEPMLATLQAQAEVLGSRGKSDRQRRFLPREEPPAV